MEDGKGAYKICPECGKKCYYHCYAEDSYACECIEDDLLLDE